VIKERCGMRDAGCGMRKTDDPKPSQQLKT